MPVQFTVSFVFYSKENGWSEDVFVITDNYSLDTFNELKLNFDSQYAYSKELITKEQESYLRKLCWEWGFCDKFFGENSNGAFVEVDYNDTQYLKKTYHSLLISGNKTK